MKLLFLLNLFLLSLYGADVDSNTTEDTLPNEVLKEDTNSTLVVEKEDDNSTSQESVRPKQDILIVKDNSGKSADEVRKLAKEADSKKRAKVSVSEVVKSIDEKGQIDLSKLQDRWEDLSPTPVKYDWVQTKSGEWFKGEIKALYDDELEFDSDEVGIYTFDFADVVQIKSYQIISVNIENLASFPGVLRLKGDKLTIIQGQNKYDFKRHKIVSFAPDGEYEKNFWSGKATLSLDVRSGNTNQYDYSATIKIQRRTSESRLAFDYLGRISSKESQEIANDHRLNQKYDMYLTRNFFWTPAFSEYYTDQYKNIHTQFTYGLGVGYTLVDTKKTIWSFSGGPAFLYTKYETVSANSDIDSYSPALEVSTHYELEWSKITDITYNYKLTFTDDKGGKYKHHMLITFENELSSWLDLDLTGVWDYIHHPQESEDGSTVKKSDFQLLVGVGIEF